MRALFSLLTIHKRSSIMVSMVNRLSIEKRAQILSCLVEGNSIRATSRMTGASKNTVTKLLVDVGEACEEYQYNVLRSLPCKRIQVDEIWSFCAMKEKNVPHEKKGERGIGDVWTWTAICADSKLCPTWLVGGRDAEYAEMFLKDVASRMAGRIQLTSDGHNPYPKAVEKAFGKNVDYAQLVKIYGKSPEQHRYSPPACVGAKRRRVNGNPKRKYVSTSYVERQNLTMRMNMRRFTRLTNAFSKKVENLEFAVALHFMNYNFARVHQTLRVSPAMEAGVTDHLWSLEEIAALPDVLDRQHEVLSN